MFSVQEFTKLLSDTAKPMFVMAGISVFIIMLSFLICHSSSVVSEKDALRNTTKLSQQIQLSENKETILIGDTVWLENNKQKYIRIE